MQKDTPMKPPSFTKEQVEYLNKLYPERCPEAEWSDRKIWISVGERRVVRMINKLFEEHLERQLGT